MGGKKEGIPEKKHSLLFSFLIILLGFIGRVLGSKWVVDGAVKIAKVSGINESFISLTIVAAGTLLPELATLAVAAYKKNSDIAVGNIVGSNIFFYNFKFIYPRLMTAFPSALRLRKDRRPQRQKRLGSSQSRA
ncbi:MAG: hypothetical protein JW928_09310 [Candidatus Aureabacteria bacterium]|nr:hypothetical protein [Candidatus Auribacterota bacterium]